jgi:tetratricopeptide (TPR) repeat protein
MLKLKLSFVCAFIAAAFLAVVSTNAQPTNPQSTLKQDVTALQKSPADTVLREKIIKLALTLDPKPAIPEEARRHYVKACTLFEDAKQPSDSADAAEEFRQALLVAPWWGDAYMKMGLALETAQRYDEAIAALKLFMATKPQDEVLRKTQDEIYKIEAKRDKAAKEAAAKAKESSPAAVAAKKQNTFDDLLKKIDGRRYLAISDRTGAIDIMNKVFVFRNLGNSAYTMRVDIQGRETIKHFSASEPVFPVKETYIISEVGDRITVHRQCGNGEVADLIYLWQE